MVRSEPHLQVVVVEDALVKTPTIEQTHKKRHTSSKKIKKV